MQKKMLTIEEVLALYRISRSTWDRMVAAKEAPQPLKFGRTHRWRLTDLQAWEDAGQPLQA